MGVTLSDEGNGYVARKVLELPCWVKTGRKTKTFMEKDTDGGEGKTEKEWWEKRPTVPDTEALCSKRSQRD